MKGFRLVLAAALALPFFSAIAQAPAAIDVDSLGTVSGGWAYHYLTGGSEAVFTDSTGTRRLALRCDRGRHVVSVVRAGVQAPASSLAIWTSTASRSLPARFAANELVADLAASDLLLDAIAFSRGRFATSAAGAPLVAVPTWAEVTRVIEDCRG